MPLIRIQTNREIPEASAVLKKLSSHAAGIIGKPETYIMTALNSNVPMTFSGTDEPLAFIECKSIGLSESQTGTLSASLCEFCERELGIPKDRIYIEFASSKGSMWGWKALDVEVILIL